MNEYIQDLASIDYLSLLTSAVIVMSAILALKSLVEKFCDAVGIEFSWIKEKREMRECQTTIKKRLKDLQEKQDRFEKQHEENVKKRNEYNEKIMSSIESLQKSIISLEEEMKVREAKNKFERLRDDIVNFANELASRDTVSSELMENYFKKIGKYESLSHEYNFKNNQAPVSIEVIKMKYQEMLLKGQITKKEED